MRARKQGPKYSYRQDSYSRPLHPNETGTADLLDLRYLFILSFFFGFPGFFGEESFGIQRVLELLVIAFQHDEGVAGGSFVILPGIPVDISEGNVSQFFLEALLVQFLIESVDQEGDGPEEVAGKAVRLPFPGAKEDTEGTVQNVVAVFVVDRFQCSHGTDAAEGLVGGQGHAVGLHQVPDEQGLGLVRLHTAIELVKGGQTFLVFLLVGKDIRLLHVFQVVIYHAPHRGVPGSGDGSDDLDGMLPVEHVVDPVTAGDLYRIDLAQVKVFRGGAYMFIRHAPLVFLVGYQVSDGDQLETDLGNIFIQTFRFHHLPFSAAAEDPGSPPGG